MKKNVILLLGILLVTTTMFAQHGTIKGIVKDKSTGEPIYSATVYIEVGGVKVGGVTDFDGKYTIKPVDAGVHTVYISVLGYRKMEISDVPLTSGNIAFVNAEMIGSEEVLGTFVVVGEPVRKEYEIPLINHGEPSVQRILPSEIKQSVNRLEPIKLVTQLPGLKLADNGRDVHVRGARTTSTQFITDGIKSTTGGIGIPGGAVGSIKVYTSGVPAQYGDVAGGVIVVETKSYFDLIQRRK